MVHQTGFGQRRAQRVVDKRCQNHGDYCVEEGRGGAEFCQHRSHLLGLAEDILLVEIAGYGICHNVKGQTRNGSQNAPFQDVFLSWLSLMRAMR